MTPPYCGEGSSFMLPGSAKHISFKGHSDSLPLCFFEHPIYPMPGCLPLRHRTLIASQTTHDIWSLNIISCVDGYLSTRSVPDHTSPLKKFPVCDSKFSHHTWDNVRPNAGCPKWTHCEQQGPGHFEQNPQPGHILTLKNFGWQKSSQRK